MTRRHITETRGGAYRSIVVGQHQVQDSWDQIHAYLSTALSPAHADVFAEPQRGQGSVSWMVDTEQEPVRLSELPQEEQEAARTRLEQLMADVAGLSDALSNGKTAQEKQWGALLKDIQKLPSQADLGEAVFVAGDQPVLTLWGMRDENSVELQDVLRTAHIRGPEEIRAVQAPGTTVSSGPVAALASGIWGWLLWLLFALLVLLVLWWLLFACALGVPGAPDLLGTCRQQTVLASLQQEQDSLREEYERLRTRASMAPPCDVPSAPPAIRPNADPVPGPATPPPPEDEAGEETEIDRARDQAEGQVGDVTVTLIWNGHGDLDLFFVCPGGTRFFANSRRSMQCGGVIDVDANLCNRRLGGAGSTCSGYGSGPVENPIENAFFTRAEAPAGEFQVGIRHYAGARSAPGAEIPYVVQVREGEVRRRFEGRAAPGTSTIISTFTVNP